MTSTNIASMTIIDPVTKKEETIAYSTELQEKILKALKRGNWLKITLLIIMFLILLVLIVIIMSGKLSLIGHNIFCG